MHPQTHTPRALCSQAKTGASIRHLIVTGLAESIMQACFPNFMALRLLQAGSQSFKGGIVGGVHFVLYLTTIKSVQEHLVGEVPEQV